LLTTTAVIALTVGLYAFAWGLVSNLFSRGVMVTSRLILVEFGTGFMFEFGRKDERWNCMFRGGGLEGWTKCVMAMSVFICFYWFGINSGMVYMVEGIIKEKGILLIGIFKIRVDIGKVIVFVFGVK